MKRILVSLCTVALLFTACTAPVKGKNGVTYKNAVDYNDYIVQKQDNVIKLIEKFKTVSQGEAQKTDAFLTDATQQVDKIITDVEGMPEWKGSSDMRDKALAMFKFYKTIFGDSYKRLVAISSDGEVTTTEEKEQDDILKKMTDVGTPIEDAFLAAQKEYASKNNMKLEKKDF
ncbi:MAG: hypothetical protein V4722_01505 [Bacteroidota bacterium]